MREAWFHANDTDVGKQVVDVVKALRDEQSGRRYAAFEAIAAYYGKSMPRSTAAEYIAPVAPADEATRAAQEELLLPLAQSILQTAKAKIASKQRPKGCVLTKGAKYRERIQAKKMSKFHEAILYQRQGRFSNSWELGEACFMDCMRWEAGVCKVYADRANERVAHERCYVYDMFVDPLDAEYGTPNSLFHLQRYDRHNLMAAYPKFKEAIRVAQAYPYDGTMHMDRADNQVAVYEAWRLPFSKKSPGRHIITLDCGSSQCVLVDEEWKRESFPFAWMVWDPAPFGIFGVPLIAGVMPIQATFSELTNDVHENVRLHGGGYTEAERGTHNEDDVASNAIGRIIWREKPGTPLNTVMPPPFNPATFQFVDWIRSLAYELNGVNEMSAQGRKEAGVDAAVAMRVMNDLQSERFLPQARSYENFFVQLCRLDIEAAQELVDAGVSVSATLPNEGFLRTIDFNAVRLPQDMYEVTIQASSSNEDTLAGRRQMVSELEAKGVLSPETAAELLSSANIDVEALGKRELAQQRYLEGFIGQCEEWEAEKDEASPYEPPDPLMNLASGIMQMTDAYMEFKADRAPEPNLALIREWITAADGMMSSASSAAAPPPADGAVPPGMLADPMMPQLPGGAMPPAPMPMPGAPMMA